MFGQLQLRATGAVSQLTPPPGGLELMLACAHTPNAHFIQVPHDADRWLYAALMLAQKIGERTFRALHIHIEEGHGEEAFGMGVLSTRSHPLYLQSNDWEASSDATDAYDVADRDARDWLESTASVIGGGATSGRNLEPAEPTLRALWVDVQADPLRFALGYAGERVGLPWAKLRGLGDEALQIKAVIARLDPAPRDLLTRLLVHGRALPLSLFEAAFPDDMGALESLASLGIVDRFGGDILLGPPWNLAPTGEQGGTSHRDLAKAFAAVADGAAHPLSVRGLSALEAQRHASRSDDPAEWQLVSRYAAYGVRSVFREAVRLSKAGDPERGRRLYRVLLDAHRAAAPRELLGRRALAYAIHYEAENLRRVEAPEVSARVMAGFQRSLQLWPENAHFWGDSIFALGLRGDLVGAREARDRAYRAVNRDHPECDRRLADVPVRRLTSHHLKSAHSWKAFALAVETPEVSTYELAELDALSLERPTWRTRSLWRPPNVLLAFKSAAGITFSRTGQGIDASFGALSCRGAHATDALEQLVAALADEIEAGLTAEPPQAFASLPLDGELMAVYGPRSRWLAALSSLRNDHGPAARLVRASWRAARSHLTGLIDDRPELTVTDDGIELSWPVSPHDGAQVEVSSAGVAMFTVADDLRDPPAPSAARAACLAWLDALRAHSPTGAARAEDPTAARIAARFGVSAATLWRWAGARLPDAVVLRDGTAAPLPRGDADALYWIDLAPSANWAHPSAFVLVGRDGAVVGEVPARWPPRTEKEWEVVRAGSLR